MKLSKKAQQSLDKVLSQFKSGDLSPITTVARIQLSKDAPATHWSLSNRILAFSQSGELDCRGYRQWEQVDRKVKKGERSVYILRPIIVKRDDQKNNEEKQKITCIGFSPLPVFPASSTEGDKPLEDYTPVTYPPLCAKNATC